MTMDKRRKKWGKLALEAELTRVEQERDTAHERTEHFAGEAAVRAGELAENYRCLYDMEKAYKSAMKENERLRQALNHAVYRDHPNKDYCDACQDVRKALDAVSTRAQGER